MFPYQFWAVGIVGAVVIAIGAAFYYRSQQQEHQHRHGAVRNARNDDQPWNRDSSPPSSKKTPKPKKRRAQPGDKCYMCCDIMEKLEDMKISPCFHAVHKSCFEYLLETNARCLECRSDPYSSPGDNCTICMDPMNENNMRFLNCGHALHKSCHGVYEKVYSMDKCPICRK